MTSLVESHYGLSKPPFTTSESSGPVFMTEPLRGTAQFVRRGLEAGKPVQCVSGPAGIGKSSFVRALPKLCSGSHHLAVLSGRAGCWDDLRRVLFREFGIREERITRDALEEARRKLGRLLIVVDDAQHLSSELLERICILPQLQTQEGEPLAQVLLFAGLDALGRDRIRPLLAWIDRDSHHAMAILDPGEVHAYLDSRLRRVGWEGHPLINESGALVLHRLSLGNPRRLSQLCRQVLEYGASRGITLIDAELAVTCLGQEDENRDELIGAALGTELCDEEGLVIEEDWQEALATAPLTADTISSAPSLELEPRDGEPEIPEPRPHFADSPPLESIRAVYRTPPPPQYISRYKEPRGQSARTLVFLICTTITAVAMYTSKEDLGLFFAGLSEPFSFAAERMEEIDRMGDSNAALIGDFSNEPAEEPDLSTVLYEDFSHVEPPAEVGTEGAADTVALVYPQSAKR